MSVISNTISTYDRKGLREDLTDAIYNISPEETPFMNNAGRGKQSAVFHEWQTDSLAAPDGSNAQLESDDQTSFASQAATTRLGNYAQISRKDAIVGGTVEAVSKAGRKSEMAYQLSKRSAELKRDMETILLSNQAAVAGNATTPRKTAGLPTWYVTNTSVGSTGANVTYTNVPTAARTDGTTRPIGETMLQTVLQNCWTAGAKPSTVMVGASNKQAISGFVGITTKFTDASKKVPTVIVGAADVYVSDFGNVTIVPNRFQRSRDAHVLDFEFVQVNYLRPFQTIPLAKTGDAEKRIIIAEYSLQVKNEAALGLIADLS